jgi:S1-C subfamily serine protease
MLAAMRTSSAIAALSLIVGLAPVAGAQPNAPPAPAAPAPAPAAPAPVVPTAPPTGGAPAAPVAPAASPATATSPAPRVPGGLPNADEVRQGVVRLERGGRLLGMGAVLRSDGRILSALSAVGHGNFIEARFADGSVLGVRVVHSDRPWDLALLAPQGGHWTQGLRPSVLDAPAPGVRLHRFRPRGGRLEAATVTVSTHEDLLGRDGATLKDALVLGRFNDDELGSPLFDEQGEVAAIVVQACAPANGESCQLAAFGAPVSALKRFLRNAPAREPLPAAWLGFRGVAAHDGSVAGVRVVSVEANGPAERAGLRGSGAKPGSRGDGASGSNADLIVAVQDAPVATPEELRDAINRFALSPAPPAKPDAPSAASERRVRLLVFGSGKFREVSLPLLAPRQLPAAAPSNKEKPAPSSAITTPAPPLDKPPSPAPPK